MFWFLIAGMLAGAVAFVAVPLSGKGRTATMTAVISVVAIAAISGGLYSLIGDPGVPSGRGGALDVEEMVASLAARLEANPDDIEGWRMLGRSYQTLGEADGAVRAYERANELLDGRDPQVLVSLGESLNAAAGGQMTPRAVGLFEQALDIDPASPGALFWSGLAAANRGDRRLAANRWELLLNSNPPAEVRELLQSRIDEWRGDAPAAATASDALPPAVVSVEINVGSEARDALPAEATVFVIARDPAQPAPPLAVVRRRLSELPTTVSLSDGDAMIPGRLISVVPALEIVVRASVSGQPAAASGDWFGSVETAPGTGEPLTITIDTRVP